MSMTKQLFCDTRHYFGKDKKILENNLSNRVLIASRTNGIDDYEHVHFRDDFFSQFKKK